MMFKRPKWFRLSLEDINFHGFLLQNQGLKLMVTIPNETLVEFDIHPDNVYELMDWLDRTYPRSPKDGKVIPLKLAQALPLRDSEEDPK